MEGIVVVGAQWGDEGKGKIVDLFCQDADAVIRYQGGNNAGHTIYHGQEKFALSALPAGIISPDKLSVIGNGVVVNPQALIAEMKELNDRGIDTGGLRISERAQVIMPYHIELDALSERSSSNRIGTTKKGIGPCYSDKINRRGIRISELIDPEVFAEELKKVLPFKNKEIAGLYGGKALDYKQIFDEYSEYGRQLKPFVVDSTELIEERLGKNSRVVFEGAQGIMLDIDQGTYPFVTSSNPTGGGAAVGSGIGPDKISDVIGVVKAYTSRVGSGPFPTELKNGIGDRIRETGHEYGVITKRPRRIGWLDAVALRHAIAVSGITKLAINSLDVLSGLDEIKIATAYKINDRLIKYFPADLHKLETAEVIYKTLPGWDEDISSAESLDELPVNAQKYIQTIIDLLDRPVLSFAVGPHRTQTHLISPLWKNSKEGVL